MTQILYVKIDNDGYIVDIIDYPFSDYVERELFTPLPAQIIAGWWKLDENNCFVFDYNKYLELSQKAAEEIEVIL